MWGAGWGGVGSQGMDSDCGLALSPKSQGPAWGSRLVLGDAHSSMGAGRRALLLTAGLSGPGRPSSRRGLWVLHRHPRVFSAAPSSQCRALTSPLLCSRFARDLESWRLGEITHPTSKNSPPQGIAATVPHRPASQGKFQGPRISGQTRAQRLLALTDGPTSAWRPIDEEKRFSETKQ